MLICAILDEKTLSEYLELCRTLGLAALTEAHDETELQMAVRCGAEIIGVNNRNLKDFTVDFTNVQKLRDKIPASCLYVAESGVTGPEDVRLLRKLGADAALIGEALMRSTDRIGMLAAMRNTK